MFDHLRPQAEQFLCVLCAFARDSPFGCLQSLQRGRSVGVLAIPGHGAQRVAGFGRNPSLPLTHAWRLSTTVM